LTAVSPYGKRPWLRREGKIQRKRLSVAQRAWLILALGVTAWGAIVGFVLLAIGIVG
jgi:hypothetical protein